MILVILVNAIFFGFKGEIRDLKYSFDLFYRYSTLCKPRIWDLLKALEVVAFFNLKYVSSYFSEHLWNFKTFLD